jgi:hypothetical protein
MLYLLCPDTSKPSTLLRAPPRLSPAVALRIFLTAWRAIQNFRFMDVYYLLAKHIEHFNFRREMYQSGLLLNP